MTWAQVCGRRLERHALSAPAPAARLAKVVGIICGAHAQVRSAVGLRVAGATRTRVREALWTDRTLVKTRGPRGTVHLLAAADLPMWTRAASALPLARSQFPDEVRMTPEQTHQGVEAIAAALAETELTVDELTEAIVAMTESWAGDPGMGAFQAKWPRWRQAEDTATRRGAMCFGANRGRKVTYTSPARWLPGFAPLPGRAALAALVERYLYAYGPAMPGHFARWLGVPTLWAAELFDSLGLSRRGHGRGPRKGQAPRQAIEAQLQAAGRAGPNAR